MDEGEFAIECLIFETSASGVRALFKHGSFENADRLLTVSYCTPDPSSAVSV